MLFLFATSFVCSHTFCTTTYSEGGACDSALSFDISLLVDRYLVERIRA
jgi:hypothetical protein